MRGEPVYRPLNCPPKKKHDAREFCEAWSKRDLYDVHLSATCSSPASTKAHLAVLMRRIEAASQGSSGLSSSPISIVIIWLKTWLRRTKSLRWKSATSLAHTIVALSVVGISLKRQLMLRFLFISSDFQDQNCLHDLMSRLSTSTTRDLSIATTAPTVSITMLCCFRPPNNCPGATLPPGTTPRPRATSHPGAAPPPGW